MFTPEAGSERDLTKVIFFGSYLPLHGIATIVAAAARLRERTDIEFELIGSGQTFSDVSQTVERDALTNVTLTPRVPIDALPARLADADICLGIFGETNKASRVVPNKVFQCMGMGKPVITADSSAMRELFTESDIVLVPAGNAQALADAVVRLVEAPDVARAIGAQGEALVRERFSSGPIARQFVQYCEEAAGSMNDVPTSTPANVLMVTSERGWRGGERQLCLLTRGLLDLGWSVTVCAPSDSEVGKRCQDLGAAWTALSIRGGVDPGAAFRLRSLLGDGQFSIVHSHTSHAHGTVMMAQQFLSRRTPHVVSRRVAFAIGGNRMSRWKYLHGADLYLAISSAVETALRHINVPAARIKRVASGIDLEAVQVPRDKRAVRADLEVAPDAFVVGCIGALSAEKGQGVLLSAFADFARNHTNARLVLVGDGPERAQLEARAHDLGVTDRVVFTGFQSDSLMYLATFDVLVMPSLSEGLGSTLLDAHATGIPVIASQVGGIPDIVDEGVTGLLVTAGNYEALSTALDRICVDKPLQNSMISASLAKSSGYDYRVMVYKTVDAYQSLLASNPPGK